ncbi:MAG TPA: hypothetical protein VFB25_02080 [Gaiellaceae bacterium]|nr:hypothetical protein [Gaiellaceae bacterium]
MPRRAAPPEAALLLPVLRGVLRMQLASQMSKADIEVRWHQKRLDLAVLSDDESLMVVELKVGDWRRAVDQAFVNRWAADSSWVALWHEKVTGAAYEAAQEAGVGLLIVTKRTVYPALRPDRPVRPGEVTSVFDSVKRGTTRIRDLLADARVVHGAAFA